MKKEKYISDGLLTHLESCLKGMEASPKRDHCFLAIEGLKKKIARAKEQRKYPRAYWGVSE